MQCLQCHAENREGSRFCAKCGTPLAAPCPHCGFANDPDAKFCGGCGKALSAPLVTESGRKRGTPEPERRQLTVMFCDLVGSTALAERLDPEELHQLLAQYQDACADVIQRYDGYIARYVGDGLLVYFGYPQAHEDDPQRAVRTGLGIVDAIKDLDAKLDNPGVDLAVRIGITTGIVVAGDIGSGERVEENAVVGETPNLAARLQALAEPNTVAIGASTERLVEGLFECDDVGAQNLKGISQAVKVYRVRAAAEAPSRFEAAAQRGLTPLVGRESELGLLLNRWKQAKAGEGQVLLLSGEAGIGKSRIVRAFRDHLEVEPHSRVLYYGSPYHQNSALHPAIDQLEQWLRFEKRDTTTQKLDRLDALLTNLGLPVADYTPLLASLLSLSTKNRYAALELDPERLKKKTIGAMITVMQTASTQQPVLMLIEDAQWIDPSTLELITGLIEHVQASRLFLLITYRPEFEPPWGLRGHITALTLNRLGRKECTAMISELTGGKALPEEVVNQIIDKTDGVPLFVEEFTKTVLESNVLEEEADRYVLSDSLPPVAIPTSLHDSLMARLDRLGPAKELAQLAATLGRTFTYELLTAVSSLTKEELEGALTHLEQAELVYRRGFPPDATYAFKHALVRDTAYQSLLKSTRQQLHQRIATTLEEQFPETAETEPELLAYHYTEAHLTEQAVGYWHRAGRRASERSARVEAVAHLTKGLKLIASLPDTQERARHELNLQITLAPVLLSIKGWAADEVEQVYLRAQELCRQVGEPSQLFAVTWGLWHHYQHCGELKMARDLANEVLALAEKQTDSGPRLQAHHAAWTTHIALAELSLCREHAERGIALYSLDEHRNHAFLYGGHDPGVCCRVNSGISSWLLGYADQALEKTQDALTLAEELGHPYGMGQALNFSAYLHQCRREAPLVQEYAEATIAFSEKQRMSPHLLAMGQVFRGWALTAEGQAKEGIAEMHEGLARRIERHRVYLLALLADAYRQTRQADQGLSVLAEALHLLEETGECTWQAEMFRLKGELVLAQSAENQTEARECFGQSIEIARRQHAKAIELRAATSLSRLCRDQGERQEARDLLAPIYSWFTEGFDTADLKEAKALLDELA